MQRLQSEELLRPERAEMPIETIEGFRLSNQQEHLWSLQNRNEGLPYRVQCAVLIEGALNVRLLEESLDRIVSRYEILRTTFQKLPELTMPLQVITDSGAHVCRYDLSDSQLYEQESRIEALFEEMKGQPLDLETGPLLHVVLLVLSPERHLLLLHLPAVCADTIALENLAREIGHYCAASPGQEICDEPLQYADLAEWQNQTLEAESANAGKAFWRKQDISTLLDIRLPFETRPSRESGFEPELRAFTISQRVVATLEQLAGRYGISVSHFLLGCWQTLLWRLTGQSDIVLGVTHDGRDSRELEKAVGLFARCLPLRCHLEKDFTFHEVLMRLGEETRRMQKWQDCFTWNQVTISGADSHGPSFIPIAFEFRSQASKYSAGGLSLSIQKWYACIDRFKIKLSCHQTDKSLEVEFHYDRNLVSGEYVDCLARQFNTLLESATDDPEGVICGFKILSDVERRRLLTDFNETTAARPESVCIHELFESQVRARPDSVAIIFKEQHLTHAALNARANQLARHLRSLGVKPEDRVGCCVTRSAEMMVAMLAIFKAGGAYLPLDGSYPSARLAQQLFEVNARVLITEEALVERLPDFEGTVLCLDRDRQLWDKAPQENIGAVNLPGQLVYVIYTSGSTGRPKAVGVTHRSLVNYSVCISRRIGGREHAFRAGLRFATVTTPTADLGNTSIFASLIGGGCLHVIDYEAATSGSKMATYGAEEQIDVLKIVPSHLRALLAAGSPADILPRQQLILGGEALSVELVRQIKSLPRRPDVLNHYGPTESTVGALAYAVEDDESLWGNGASVPIGRPLANMQAYVLDQFMEPVAPGVAAELYLGGVGLARGYLNEVEQTAERFVPNPFSRIPGERLYRTGDLARHLLDGNIEFLGRTDHQVKIRGYRIELGEIEALLKKHKAVQTAVVIAREDQPERKRLVAYVVPSPANAPRIEGKRRYVLPNQMAIVQHNEYETRFFYKQIFVDQTNLKHIPRLPKHPCVFDVGANIGLFTLYISRRYEDAAIHAFEPIRPTFELLRMNTALYAANARLYNCGLADSNRKVTFTHYPQSSCMSSYYADAARDRETLSVILKQQEREMPEMAVLLPYLDEVLTERIKSQSCVCQLRTISEIISESAIEQIDLLKIDVEKSELDVLRGVRDEDWRKIKNIVIEAHDVDGQLARLTSLLGERGYNLIVEQDTALEKTGLFNVYAFSEEGSHAAEKPTSAERLRAPDSSPLSVEELQNYLKLHLPEYMVPEALIIQESLPLTPNGKIDRLALPPPEEVQSHAEYVPPRDEIENILASVWQKVLGVTPIGIHDDYFSLGGDSIRVIEIVHEIQQCGLSISVMDVLRNRTVSELARSIRERKAGTREKTPPPLALTELPQRVRDLLPAEIEDGYPVSQMQQFVIFHYSHDQQQMGVYHIQQSYHIFDAKLSLDAFRRAIAIVANSHPAMRTVFVFDGDSVEIQAVKKTLTLQVKEVDIKGLSAAEQEEYINEALRQDRDTPFEVANSEEPLFRFALFIRSETTVEFFMSIHHAITDGWGNQSFLNELVEVYLAFRDGELREISAWPDTYKEFVALEREILSSREARVFWQDHLRDQDHRRLKQRAPAIDQTSPVNYLESVNPKLANELHELSKGLRVSIKATLLSSYLDLISSVTGAAPVTVGVVSNGRSERLSNPLKALGLFWNIIPFCCPTDHDDKLEQIKVVQQLLIDAELYARYPLLQILKDQRRPELFSATFNFLHFHHLKAHPGRKNLELLGTRFHDKFHFPLNYIVSVDPDNGRILVRVEYDKLYFSDEAVRLMTASYIDLLTRATR